MRCLQLQPHRAVCVLEPRRASQLVKQAVAPSDSQTEKNSGATGEAEKPRVRSALSPEEI